MNDPNVLAYIPGDVVAAGIQTLPDPDADVEAYRCAEVDVPMHGFRARITYKRFRYTSRRSGYWTWVAERAVKTGTIPIAR